MQTEEMVSAKEFCIHHSIDLSFIYSLNQYDLIEIMSIEEEVFVPVSQLKDIERMIRMHHEMGINVEGIETITYLLQRINNMQQQIVQLTNRLNKYENE